MARPVISPEETPTTAAWSLYPLYKQPARGKLRMWQVGFDGVDHLEIQYGSVGGVITSDRTEVKLNNSKRNMQEQALLEARRRYLNKYREGYEPETAPLSENKKSSCVKAMKSYKYQEGMIKHWPVITQPKLDGIRMVALMQDGVLSLRSKLNNPFSHLTHMKDDITRLLTKLPAGAMLDGELYAPGLSFQELSSVVKRVKVPHPRLCEVQYWIFDVDLPSLPVEARYNTLAQAMGYPLVEENKSSTSTENKNLFPTLRLVPSQLAYSHNEILQQHNLYVAQGYEGVMIKKTAFDLTPDDPAYAQALYKGGRTQNILKYKDFQDEEVDITGVQEAEGNQKGAVVFEVRDLRGNDFTVSMEGPLAQRREWFQHPELVIGKKLTIRYQELTNKGVPRFPVGVAVRDYE